MLVAGDVASTEARQDGLLGSRRPAVVTFVTMQLVRRQQLQATEAVTTTAVRTSVHSSIHPSVSSACPSSRRQLQQPPHLRPARRHVVVLFDSSRRPSLRRSMSRRDGDGHSYSGDITLRPPGTNGGMYCVLRLSVMSYYYSIQFGQQEFDTAKYTQNDSPGDSTGPGEYNISMIVFLHCITSMFRVCVSAGRKVT